MLAPDGPVEVVDKAPLLRHPSVYIDRGVLYAKEDIKEWARTLGYEIHLWPVVDLEFLVEVVRYDIKKQG